MRAGQVTEACKTGSCFSINSQPQEETQNLASSPAHSTGCSSLTMCCLLQQPSCYPGEPPKLILCCTCLSGMQMVSPFWHQVPDHGTWDLPRCFLEVFLVQFQGSCCCRLYPLLLQASGIWVSCSLGCGSFLPSSLGSFPSCSQSLAEGAEPQGGMFPDTYPLIAGAPGMAVPVPWQLMMTVAQCPGLPVSQFPSSDAHKGEERCSSSGNEGLLPSFTCSPRLTSAGPEATTSSQSGVIPIFPNLHMASCSGKARQDLPMGLSPLSAPCAFSFAFKCICGVL